MGSGGGHIIGPLNRKPTDHIHTHPYPNAADRLSGVDLEMGGPGSGPQAQHFAVKESEKGYLTSQVRKGGRGFVRWW